VNRVLERIFAVGVVFLAMGGCATRPTDTTTLSKAWTGPSSISTKA